MIIWGKYGNQTPEKIDTAPKHDAQRMLREYNLAFGCFRGGPHEKKWKLWLGRRKDEPK
jgi:hypothetical protein